MKKITLLFVISLFFGCNSDDTSNTNPATAYKLTKIEEFNENGVLRETITFEYDSNFRVKKITEVNPNPNPNVAIWEYMYNGDRVSSIVINGETTQFEYSGDLITSSTFTEDGIVFTDEFEYNSSNQLVSEKQYTDGVLDCETTYQYAQGNVSTMSDSCFIGSIDITYDDRLNPETLAYNNAMQKIYQITPNNENSRTHNGSGFTETSTYTYNSENYPESRSLNAFNIMYTTNYTYEVLAN